MIYTITLNPAIDRILKFKDFKLNKTNRANYDKKYAAGKGIHIAKLLGNLNEKCKAIYLSGSNDKWFENNLKKENIDAVKFNTNGYIRTNLKLISKNQQTECNGIGLDGPYEDAVLKICFYLKNNLKQNDFVVIAGSFPNGFKKSLLDDILTTISLITKNIVIDISDVNFLPLVINYKPIFIKPNISEMELFIEKGYSESILLKNGIENIIISMGSKGVRWINKINEKDIIINKKFEINNLAGSGDSLVAGVIYKLVHNYKFEEAIKFGVVCGTATACSDKIASLNKIKEIDKELKWNTF